MGHGRIPAGLTILGYAVALIVTVFGFAALITG
jgi:hypothetical protein